MLQDSGRSPLSAWDQKLLKDHQESHNAGASGLQRFLPGEEERKRVGNQCKPGAGEQPGTPGVQTAFSQNKAELSLAKDGALERAVSTRSLQKAPSPPFNSNSLEQPPGQEGPLLQRAKRAQHSKSRSQVLLLD